VKKIALIACSNGYGHIRRLLLLAQELDLYHDVQTTLLAPVKVVNRLVQKLKISSPKLIDFDTHTSQSNWINGSSNDWYKKLPNLEFYNIVISDNLIEILHIRPDAWLSGSFFWHESLENFPLKQKDISKKLLKKYRPKMVSSKLFSSPYLSHCTRLYEVGLFSNCIGHKIEFNRNRDILIATGKGVGVDSVARYFVNSLINLKGRRFDKLWVEPNLLPEKNPEWMVPATFTVDMYKRIAAAIIRPGVGTVTDSLVNGAKIFPFYEQYNNEMIRNVCLLSSNGYSVFTSNITSAWDDAMMYLENELLQREHIDNINALDVSGAKDFAKIILNSV
jgi:hypothetical protein